VVQITSPRIPCVVFAGWLDEDRWVKRFAGAGRPGAYLRVLREGVVRAGDGVEVIGRPGERVTLAESMTAFYGDAELMRRLLRVEGRGTKWDEIAVGVLGRAVLARGSTPPPRGQAPGPQGPEPPDGQKAPVTSSLGSWPPARGT